MRRDLALVAVFAIVVFSIANPLAYVDSRTRGNEHQEALFLTAADGAESSESITSFSETIDDNSMYYPDGYNGSITRGDYRNNMDTLSGWWFLTGCSSLAESSEMVTVNGTASGGSGSKEKFGVNEPAYSTVNDDYHIVFQVRCNVTSGLSFYVYMATEDGGLGAANGLREFTLASANTWYTQVLNVSDGANPVESYVWAIWTTNGAQDFSIDVRLLVEVERYNSFSGYFCDFAGVNDWTTSDTSISSDGDLATITENGAGSTGRTYASFSSTDHFEHYYEFRIYSMTATTANLEFWDGAAYNTLKTFTAAGTYKGLISDTDAATMQRIGFLVGSEGGNIKPDYLRLSPADESGWAHDCSTTAGVTNDGEAGVTYTTSTDGDKLTLQAVRTSGSGTLCVQFAIAYDTTTTSIDIERDYYPFFELSYSATLQGGVGWVAPFFYLDGKYQGGFPELYEDGEEHIARINTQAFTASSSSKHFGVYANLQAEGAGFIFILDYVKAYSIANDTLTHSGITWDDYLYVDSGVLYSHIDDGYIELNHDPALTVNTATYNVWNLTTSGTAPEFDNYVGSWAGYSSETRGSLSSGTLTDLRLKFDSIESISAITFIEDGTAPDADIVVSPDPPDDDEQVTLSSIVFDDVEVYKVWYNAISYPAGFSDVDYEATEGQENYWSYSFSSLIAGDYCFKVIANDGANNSTVTQANRDYATARFTVREAAIRLDPINQEGAEPDATHYQVSFVCNKDGDWSVTEWTQTDGSDAAETHTGVVVEGWNNIAWEKLDTDSSVVYFNMTVTNSTLTKTVPGLYLVAQTTFYVDASTTEGLDTVTVTGRITKLGNYLLYDENNELKDSGSITDLDFTIRFTKWSGYDEQDHDFAIKFTNGTQTCWYNSSYYAFKKPVAAAVVTTDKNALYAFQASFWTAIMILFVLGMVGVDFYRRYK